MRNSTTSLGIQEKSRYFVQSVAKGLSLLQALSEAGKPLMLSELAHYMGVGKTTATRFAYTLIQLGFIYRDDQRRYSLTPKVLNLGYSVIRRQDWLKVAQYYLERLFRKIEETVNLAVLDSKEILYLFRIKKGEDVLPFDLQIGSKLPVHCTSMGKILMAFGPPKKTRPVLKILDFWPFTQRTITRLEDYLKELENSRKKGYAINDEELSVGLRSVAAPVRDEHGWATAAISIVLHTKRFSRKDLEKTYAPRVMQTAEEISQALKEMEWHPICDAGALRRWPQQQRPSM
jgi:IclR family pca regulon transcriptional regulator